MSSSAALHSAVSYLKLPGTLALDVTSLSWNPSSSSSTSPSAFALPLTSISGLSVSKAGSPNVALQVAFDEEGVKATGLTKAKVLLTFTGGVSGDKAKAEAKREEFKTRLVEVIGENKARKGASDTPGGPATAVPSPAVSATPSKAPTATGSPAAAATPSGDGAATPIAKPPAAGGAANKSSAAANEFALRVSLLKSNPSLAALHKQTVMAGLIPDADFWSHPTRQALLRAARQAAGQQKGRNARIVDPRFQVGKNGELKLEITDEDRRDLLEQNEVLKLAWKENVPDKLDESSFWQRYFTSSLYHVLRTSSRSASLLNNSRAAPGGTSSLSASVRPDAIFDSYLPLVHAKYVDTLEPPPSSGQKEARNRLVDLGATESDHNPTGNEKDWTMRGGAERGVLPLVRRFNEHSERVLSAALGDSDTAPSQSGEAQDAEQLQTSRRKRARTEGERGVELEDQGHSRHAQRYEEDIVIEDLEEKREAMVLPLELASADDGTGRAGALGRRAAHAKSSHAVEHLDKVQSLSHITQSLSAMHGGGVITLDFDIKAKKSRGVANNVTAVEQELRELLVARRERGWSDLTSLPEHLRKRTTELHGSATEVMRQFWNSVSPPDDDDKNVKLEEGETPPTPPTPEEREAKAKRMVTILSGIPAQIEELLHQSGGGSDEEKIGAALATTREACQRAVMVCHLIYN